VLPDRKLADVFVSADFNPKTGVTRWTSPEPDSREYAAAALSAIAERDGGELLDAFVPDEALSGGCPRRAERRAGGGGRLAGRRLAGRVIERYHPAHARALRAL
jgi:hypothetical protein